MLYRAGRYKEAQPWLEKAAILAPSDHETAFNLGAFWYSQGEMALSEECYSTAAASAPDEAAAAHVMTHMAYPVLAAGDYRRGLSLYDQRFVEIAKTQAWELGIPEWRGEDPSGKRILIHHDQGVGDDIQFCRFLPELRKRGAQVILAVPRELRRLMSWPQFVHGDALTELVDIEGGIPRADYHSPMLTYLRYLDTPLPPVEFHPYFQATERSGLQAAERSGLYRHKPAGTKLAIGLVWASRPNGGLVAQRRSIPLEMLLPLAEIPGVALYSLQVGHGAEDISGSGAGVLVDDLSSQLRHWADTATYMADLDLIVSVDSGPLHLAGAMGRPCVGLLPFVGCWRWGLPDASGTPWYPTMKLLRQGCPGDWTAPVERLLHFVRNLAMGE